MNTSQNEKNDKQKRHRLSLNKNLKHSPKKENPCSNTIISLFKKHTTKVLAKAQKKEATKTETDSDDDIQIVSVTNVSNKYFHSNEVADVNKSSQILSPTSLTKANKLKLKRCKSTLSVNKKKEGICTIAKISSESEEINEVICISQSLTIQNGTDQAINEKESESPLPRELSLRKSEEIGLKSRKRDSSNHEQRRVSKRLSTRKQNKRQMLDNEVEEFSDAKGRNENNNNSNIPSKAQNKKRSRKSATSNGDSSTSSKEPNRKRNKKSNVIMKECDNRNNGNKTDDIDGDFNLPAAPEKTNLKLHDVKSHTRNEQCKKFICHSDELVVNQTTAKHGLHVSDVRGKDKKLKTISKRTQNKSKTNCIANISEPDESASQNSVISFDEKTESSWSSNRSYADGNIDTTEKDVLKNKCLDESLSPCDDNDDGNENETNDKSEFRDRTPYYLENFTIIMCNVLEDEDNKQLFNEDDMRIVNIFKSLSESAQKLYVRLFSRKLTWHLFHKIKYLEIADDLTPALNELISAQLALSAVDLNNLDTVLRILPLNPLKLLAKSFNININQTKPFLLECLLKQSKQNTIGSFFTKKSKGGDLIMLDRAKKLLGESFKLLEEPRAVFIRILNLFSILNYNPEEDSPTGNHGQLFQMLLVNMGKLVYPEYTISKETRIFRNRDDLLRFSAAMCMENDLLTYIDKGEYQRAHDLYITAKEDLEKLLKDTDQIAWDKALPSFLRRYTARQVYTRILSQGVEILQRFKRYPEAVEQLRQLLNQSEYCLKYRGYWFDRLALNLDQHLNKTQESLDVIKEGLKDEGVRVGHRYSLFWRANKICSASKSKFTDQLTDMESVEVLEYPKVTIEGKVLSKTIPGARFTFVMESGDDEGGITVCRVEELVLDYYKNSDFTEGIHAEGSVVSTLFGLYFWDVIFMEVPDAFHSPFQALPLDHHGDHFYHARQNAIEQRLHEIKNMSEEDLENVLSKIWDEKNGVLCGGLNWERFNSLQHVQGLVRCIGGPVLSDLLQRYARDPRNTRSGFPDLTLWNPDAKTFKFCEVKGPGDRLSSNQIMWLDYLMRLGVDAEVCHVKAVTGKKLTRN